MTERADALANRSRILNAAREVFAEKSTEAQIGEIAARAEVGVGTIYRNFPTKDDLLVAVVRESQERVAVGFLEARRIEDPAEGLRCLFTHMLRAVEDYGWLIEAMWSGQLPADCRAIIESSPYDELLQDLLRTAMDKGYLRKDLNLVVAASSLLGMVVLVKSVGVLEEMTADAAAAAMVDLFIHGAL